MGLNIQILEIHVCFLTSSNSSEILVCIESSYILEVLHVHISSFNIDILLLSLVIWVQISQRNSLGLIEVHPLNIRIDIAVCRIFEGKREIFSFNWLSLEFLYEVVSTSSKSLASVSNISEVVCLLEIQSLGFEILSGQILESNILSEREV